MARTTETLIGTLLGIDAHGASALVRVYKAGRDYRITHGDKRHLCHPSVRSIDKVKAEAFLVFHVGDATYEAL
jgi:hypothetical protein